ncbi:outer membrane protein assembly factor BamC [Neptuniibacter sp. 1_MG-2023]|uniref:outer membrane protein assembly factor BamC n=1 Tax=Neptuniibacter sp. 1_MG-2023 TaxID=3062662 RepID=UPI0026E23467|nr:outer membrane protein assembly factor BamC [Neptuniibacter sp. 1_MG-2023]MDO6592273.1 outer membrane protein assembly factor BamC [Neptuniibacter sp. 1_MG-2023]
MKKILALSTVSLLMAGCGALDNNPIYGENGIVRDRSQDYELAETGQRLEVPEHLNVKQTEESLTIPEISDVATARTGDFIVPRPEFFYAESGTEAVSLKREDGDKLIIVDEGITNVWVKLQEFWQFNGIDIVKSDPRQGVMETQWITHEAKELSFVDSWVKRLTFQDLPGATKDKLQVSLKPVDGDPNRTSIAMQHIRFAEDNEAAEVDWSEQARGVSYKSDMMFEMLRYLGKATGDRSAQTLVAFQEQRRLGTQLGRDSRGNAVLKLDADVESAWNNVSTALDKADMDVGTRDPDLGLFYMTYTTSTPFENEEEMGFFEWLHADRGPITLDTSAISAALGVEDDSEGISYTSGKTAARFQNTENQAAGTLNDPEDEANKKGYKIWFAGKPIYVFGGDDSGVYNANSGKFEHTGQYQLKLIRTRTGVYLSVLTAEGVAAPAVIGEEILWEIKEQLPRS